MIAYYMQAYILSEQRFNIQYGDRPPSLTVGNFSAVLKQINCSFGFYVGLASFYGGGRLNVSDLISANIAISCCIYRSDSPHRRMVMPVPRDACKKTDWQDVGVVICLERGADLHMAQLMPLPFTVYCFSKIQIGFTFLVPAHPGCPGQRAIKRVCV